MSGRLAVIELGTHTARMLVGGWGAAPGVLRETLRDRVYVRLAEGMRSNGGRLSGEALDRAVAALRGFRDRAGASGVERFVVIGTGVLREASNGQDFLRRLAGATGFRLRLLSGEEEARFTASGVLWALGMGKGPFVVFDLGGGSTEFMIGGEAGTEVFSVPIGAAVLTEAHFAADPPLEHEIEMLRRAVDRATEPILKPARGASPRLAGTGGTAVTLAAMLHGLPVERIDASTVNGLRVEKPALTALFEEMRRLKVSERARMTGLDAGRAPVILAGTLCIMQVMEHLDASVMTVSLSDLLEGILMDQLKGEKHAS
ncbi:Ppx/GppA phosphatase family protein [Desulfatiglans anilini]|uniref:Ppx/GppA phosphatase family protein n=1 Tax=Desulfatiglans anilini TaxID=90728 RepID=UPI0012947A94|nr:hypothetical protein [Desulfatiglans anilini]